MIPLGKLKRLLFIALLVVFGCEDKEKDCAGVESGTAVLDECGVCDGSGPVENYDCAGNCISGLDCAAEVIISSGDNPPKPWA